MKIKAKDMHRINLLSYLREWENPWPKGTKGLAKICKVKPETICFHFTPAELDEIRSEGLELRKKNSHNQRASVYDAMLKEAKKGNTTAQNSFLDRTEGKIKDKIEHGFDSSALKMILGALPAEYAESVKAQLSEIIKK